MTRHCLKLLAPVLMLAACGGNKESAATPAVDSTAAPATESPVAAPPVDTAVAPDSAKAAAPTVAPAAKPAAKAETGDHDIAIKPRFKIDEKTGKIDTIKRP
ncbi:MAG: hypothetical protein P3B98_00020 [Gemmatimonadota bacterium]|nr:hypothetical protein [Gemmatimonadota bacterium]